MCLCKLVVFTFSNKMAFRRLEHKLSQLNEELANKCSPKGTVYIIKSCGLTPEERDDLPFEALMALVEAGLIRTYHIHFQGWEKYYKMRKRVGDKDVFGKLEVKVV